MEELKQQTRERIISRIPDLLNECLARIPEPTASRILGDTPNSDLDPEDYLESLSPFVSTIQDHLRKHHPSNPVGFLAVNIYPGKHPYFIVDFNNIEYDYATAHGNTTPIPVYVLRLSKRAPTMYGEESLDQTDARELAAMHNGHGQSPLPLVNDYNQAVLQYANPRSLRR